MKRVALFVLTNILVITLVSIIFALTGLGQSSGGGYLPVSYTHLTLPTICSV